MSDEPEDVEDICNEIAEYARKKGLNIWIYSGFTFEQILKMAEKKPIYLEFLKKADVLVDGRFQMKKRNLNLLFRGSSNQRLIDVPKSLERGEVVLFNEYEYSDEKEFKREPMYV